MFDINNENDLDKKKKGDAPKQDHCCYHPKRKFDTSTQEPNKDVGTTTGKVGMPRQEPNKLGMPMTWAYPWWAYPPGGRVHGGHIHWMGMPIVGISTGWVFPMWAYPCYMLNAKEYMMTPGGCQQERRKAGASKGWETGPAQIPELQKHAGKKLLPVAMEGEDRCYVKGRRPGTSEGCKMGPTQVPELQKQAGKKLLPGAPGTASKHIVAVEVQGRRPGASKGCKTGPTQVPESQKRAGPRGQIGAQELEGIALAGREITRAQLEPQTNSNGAFQSVGHHQLTSLAMPVSYDLTSISYGATGHDKLVLGDVTITDLKISQNFRLAVYWKGNGKDMD
ncbi:hypothetical protein DFH07DRAFT_768853 [Mycena maculata]|uniref:Uncharacterized protein n=1 Tax=Mycena maculata TaxID=230809 RepID=A0AAD7NPJ2_9AGAR|nr:hypothetical protein DFH07DRAFT_768853 [Mycena maculata]